MVQQLQLEELFKQFQCSHNACERERVFTQIVCHLQPILFIKFKSLGTVEEDLKDLMQEIMIRIYLALPTFDFNMGIPFEHYLNCIVYSMKKDFWRKKYTELHKQDTFINEYIVTYQSNHFAKKTEKAYLRQEQREQLERSLGRLSKLESRVAKLMLLDYSPIEIAKALGVKDKVVYNTIQRCKMKMKDYLTKYYDSMQ
ncbi:sigma-70 family RNA polymerase sigma factor [Staphylococcus caledonicus]|uniref:sigma-70 family RNA polymerase sigma factor n=1 Tax=Staphylococcus caledonicus TaxID=2741333 RepID=UPI003C2EB499